jgi:hypothetical protein
MHLHLTLTLVAVLTMACAPAKAPPLTSLLLTGTDGTPHRLSDELHAHAYTAVVFFSRHCICQTAHNERIRSLIAREGPRGVGFLVVDPEESATRESDARESTERGYPIVLDTEGRLARALGADFATYSAVLDSEGRVLYRGGFDSERSHLSDSPRTYLANALDDLLDGKPPRQPQTKPLGCALELH